MSASGFDHRQLCRQRSDQGGGIEPQRPWTLHAAAVSGERREIAGARRAAQLLRGRRGLAAAAGPQHQRRGLGLRGAADLRAPCGQQRRVYAVDLPGFGFSDRSRRGPTTVRLYSDAVHDMLDVIAAETGGQPVDALAVSLGCEFLARAAVERPERFRTLAAGHTHRLQPRPSGRLHGPPGIDPRGPGPLPALHLPALEPGLLRPAREPAAASATSCRRPSARSEIDEGLLDYDYLTTHQPGARHAPYAFVSGRLFSRDIRTVYERLDACRSGCRTARAATSGTSARPVGGARGRTGGCSRSTTGRPAAFRAAGRVPGGLRAVPRPRLPHDVTACYERLLRPGRARRGQTREETEAW